MLLLDKECLSSRISSVWLSTASMNLLMVWFFSDSQVEIMVGLRLKPTESSREWPTKKVTENPILTNHFIIFYHLNEKWQGMFYFFKKLQVFLFLLIPILHFVLLFIKEYVYWLHFILLVTFLLQIDVMHVIEMQHK